MALGARKKKPTCILGTKDPIYSGRRQQVNRWWILNPTWKKRWTSIGHTWLDPVVVNRSQMGLHSSLPIPFSEPGFKPLIESIEENNRINPPSLFNLLNPFRLLFLIVRDYWFSTIQSDYRGHPKCPPRQISGIHTPLPCTLQVPLTLWSVCNC